MLLIAVVVAGCGFGNRSGGSIFDIDSDNRCSYDNDRYAQGSTICRSGNQLRCTAGKWKDRGENCRDDATARCTFKGDAYATGKARCQSGKRFRCEDGAWKNTGNTCKG